MNIDEALTSAEAQLAHNDGARQEAQMLLCHILAKPLAYLHMWPETMLTATQSQGFNGLIEARIAGQPIAHLLEQRGFWTLDLKVTADTLIPRPDTELLVSMALQKMQPNMIVADLGTGTGAIGLSLAKEQPAASLIATDLSEAALQVANYNAQKNHIKNIHFWQGSWLDAIADNCLDIIVSNPPYIAEDDPHLSMGDIQFEPLTALVSGHDGLDDIRKIITEARRCLKPLGWLMIEHGYQQAKQVRELLRDAGFGQISSERDYGGHNRVVMAQQPHSVVLHV